MTANEIKLLKEYYNLAVQNYVEAFCKKTGFEFDGWVADKVGEVGLFMDFYFDFQDIKYDIDTKQPKGKIIQWHDYNVDYNTNIKDTNDYININYSSYCMGARRK
jgi:hypothetical protein